MNIKTNQTYIIIGVIILIILGLLLWGRADAPEVGDEVADTSTTTPTDIQNTREPSSTGSTPKPAPTQNNTIIPKPTEPTNQEPVPSIPSASSLNGIIFRMALYNGTAITADTKYTLSFSGGSGGTLSAKFCNNMSGNFILDGSLLKVTNFTSTKMYCAVPSNLMEIESAFTSMLNFGATIYRSDDNIIISSASKNTVMVFEGF